VLTQKENLVEFLMRKILGELQWYTADETKKEMKLQGII
jgi:hypothetical protein